MSCQFNLFEASELGHRKSVVDHCNCKPNRYQYHANVREAFIADNSRQIRNASDSSKLNQKPPKPHIWTSRHFTIVHIELASLAPGLRILPFQDGSQRIEEYPKSF
jgi:hypothetical protein